MSFLELAAARYSVRAYRPDAVEEEKLKVILEAARLAPTAANLQPFRLIVCQTRERREELREIYHRDWFLQAPLLIVACGLPEQAWKHRNGKSYLDVDVAIVMDHITLAAADVGLGTCWIASFDFEAARRVFRIPLEAKPVVLTPLGYPAEPPQPKERKGMDDLVFYEHWK